MNNCSWADIKADMQHRRVPAPQREPESFRQDFKARASLMRQVPPHACEQAGIPLLNWRTLASGMAALVIAAMLIRPSPEALVNQVKSLQVFVPHSGVIIMSDEDDSGMVVWVTDMESDEGNKG